MNDSKKEISDQEIQETLKGIDIPSPPQLIVELQQEMARSNINISNIEAIVSKDVGISGKVIKLVNSPFFGLRSNIGSIQHAINLLGVENIINIVNSIAIRQSFSKHNLVDMTRFWDNATDVAMTSAFISRVLGIACPNEAYMLGLFHNSGIALLIERFPNYSDTLKIAYSETTDRITDVENHHIQCNHAVAGYFVAKSWKLPSYICESIADHHKTHAIFSGEMPYGADKKNLLAILKLSETICKTYQTFGSGSIDYEFEMIKEDLFCYLGISKYEFDELIEDVHDNGLNN